MKKLLHLLTCSLITVCFYSCATYQYTNYIQLPSLTDFRPYTEAGFFISPGIEGVKYKSIGMVKFTFCPGMTGNPTIKQSDNYPTYKESGVDAFGYYSGTPKENKNPNNLSTQKETREFFEPSEEYMLEKVVEYARLKGATGLLNYKISYSYQMPSILGKMATQAGEYEIKTFHPLQRYGEATITAFAVEIVD